MKQEYILVRMLHDVVTYVFSKTVILKHRWMKTHQEIPVGDSDAGAFLYQERVV